MGSGGVVPYGSVIEPVAQISETQYHGGKTTVTAFLDQLPCDASAFT